MQRPFTSFPSGCPGVGLLLLRIVVAASVIGYVWRRALDVPLHGFDIVSAALSISGGVTILVGLFTPQSAAILAAAIAWTMLPVHGLTPAVSIAPAAFALTDALVIGLLGPGAFSVDARLYGRREIIVARGPGSLRNTR